MNKNNDDPYNMASKSIDELLTYICSRTEDSKDHQFAKIELKKRELQTQHELNEAILSKQHELNLEITKKQAKTQWRSTVFGALCALLGTIVGVALATYLPLFAPLSIDNKQQSQQKQINSKESIQPKTVKMKHRLPTSQNRKTTEESLNNKKEKEVSKQPPLVKK